MIMTPCTILFLFSKKESDMMNIIYQKSGKLSCLEAYQMKKYQKRGE